MAVNGVSVNTDVFAIGLPWAPSAHDGSSTETTPSGAVRRFLGGPENRLVRTAVEALDHPHPPWNPVVFYGPTATGKSHLAAGLLARWKQSHPDSQVVTTTGADFSRTITTAARRGEPVDFMSIWQSVDALLIDNLHELANFPSAQELLVLRLDELIASDRLVLATCVGNPLENFSLSRRLVSRLSSGLLVPVEPPSAATRQALALHFAMQHQVDMTAAAAKQLAEAFSTNLPELQGMLLELFAREFGSTPQLGKMRRIDSLAARRFISVKVTGRTPSLQAISSAAARYYQVKITDLRGPSRRQSIVAARDAAIFLARKLTKSSFAAIGKHFGGRDHTTIMHSIQKLETRRKREASTQSALDELERLIQRQTQ
ncbi:chromosomal replication initiator protein DnaA [Blastopirellula marina DSM 3645]|uniref:Chromosomal replication initiator protein DnaA n=1 Tax=Blastopirellula marina DSM 3645 TaxID=314230 RepID=A3ZRE8_9BACT|nr:chromosomal replication initiator protein DnaA [Blastopirellula marina DSM 3645]